MRRYIHPAVWAISFCWTLIGAPATFAEQARRLDTALMPLLKNPTTKWDHPAITQVRRGPAASRYMGYSIRTEKWRYTQWDKGKRGAELYDETVDPHESNNLAADPKHQKVVADMQRRLRRVSGQ